MECPVHSLDGRLYLNGVSLVHIVVRQKLVEQHSMRSSLWVLPLKFNAGATLPGRPQRRRLMRHPGIGLAHHRRSIIRLQDSCLAAEVALQRVDHQAAIRGEL
jgi:hypothetical protein